MKIFKTKLTKPIRNTIPLPIVTTITNSVSVHNSGNSGNTGGGIDMNVIPTQIEYGMDKPDQLE